MDRQGRYLAWPNGEREIRIHLGHCPSRERERESWQDWKLWAKWPSSPVHIHFAPSQQKAVHFKTFVCFDLGVFVFNVDCHLFLTHLVWIVDLCDLPFWPCLMTDSILSFSLSLVSLSLSVFLFVLLFFSFFVVYIFCLWNLVSFEFVCYMSLASFLLFFSWMCLVCFSCYNYW